METLEQENPSKRPVTTPRPVLSPLDLSLSISASFFASGFIAWGLLQIKESTMAIADWIRKHTEKDLERRRQEARREGLQQGLREGYEQGYGDARAGKPKQAPSDDSEARPEST
jgi:flagellar biosynthesis/type III secretory pathway protein FliH